MRQFKIGAEVCVVVMGSVAALASCSPASTVPKAVTAAPAGTPTTAAPTNPAGARGTIVGTVATNPWRALKSGAVVYVEDAPKDASKPKSATLDNHDMAFDPGFVVVSAGGAVVFTNTDPLLHNVFSPDADKWDLGDIPQHGSVVKRFDVPAHYAVLCNRHPNMLAYLAVTPSGFFAKTDADGKYTIRGLPAGTYHVTAWVPRLQPLTQTVTIGDTEATANFSLER